MANRVVAAVVVVEGVVLGVGLARWAGLGDGWRETWSWSWYR